MYAEFLSFKLVLVFAVIAAILVCLKLLLMPHKYQAEEMTYDLRAMKKQQQKPIEIPPRPAIRKCKVHPPKRGR